MELVPWRPFRELAPLRREMDSLFRKFFGESPFEATQVENWVPPMDVSETAESITVRVELPGLEVKDIDVSLLGDSLTIKGEKTRQEEKKGEHFHCVERYCGSFERSFRLPATVIPEKIEARFEKGILSIELPKTEEAKTKAIKIEVK
jgi:HSP20 family protein